MHGSYDQSIYCTFTKIKPHQLSLNLQLSIQSHFHKQIEILRKREFRNKSMIVLLPPNPGSYGLTKANDLNVIYGQTVEKKLCTRPGQRKKNSSLDS